ncbi:carboxylesterase family protein [Sphingomonas sp. HF-S3]|uniref:Carboxylic ester hydrolase n=1 Tax=Sphingomonas rustica TaxID=3103142 RepID=A0ABV0BA32_9SPHN
MRTGIRKVMGLAVAAMAIQALPAAAQIRSATVAEGQLAGKSAGAVSAFLGVPFAAPPVAENRWKPPLAAARWQGVRRADTLPSSCRQEVTPNGFGPWTHEYVVTNAVSEDCLYLNVWTPAKTAAAKLPVLVWIHGGAFSSGSASVPIYDGSALAAKGIVVIAINYRLGLYGFMAHPGLTAESPAGASGNYGLLDQVAALKWIKANAAAFGGDPARITIAGQSAGAASVHHLIATPLAKGLFVRAIAQSGSGMGLNVPARATAEARGTALMTSAGAGSIDEMRRLSPDQLEAAAKTLAGAGGLAFAPVVDGLVFPDTGTVGANTNDTPILTGMTADEMTGLNPAFGKATAAQVQGTLASSYGALAPQFLKLYPAASDAEANATVSALARDRGLAAMAFWAQQRQRGSRNPVYAYLWSHWEPGPDAARYRAFHSSEIPYVFGTLGASPERPFGAADRRLSALLGDYWVNWVKRGDPNGSGLPHWPRYSSNQQIIEIGDDGAKARPILPADTLDLFTRYVESGGRVSLF